MAKMHFLDKNYVPKKASTRQALGLDPIEPEAPAPTPEVNKVEDSPVEGVSVNKWNWVILAINAALLATHILLWKLK